MIGFTINEAKSYFLKGDELEKAVARAEYRIHSRFGAFIRSDARRSIRNRKRPSRPGEAPTNQTGLLKGNIFFVVERDMHNVVIGPALLSGKKQYLNLTIPEVLEKGGTVAVPARRKVKAHTANFGPRPYMGPAFDKNLPTLPALWRDSVKAR